MDRRRIKIPKIQAEEVLKNAISVGEITATVIISGSGLEALKKKDGKFYLKVEVPIAPLPIPDELPGGTFKWNDSFNRGDFKEITEKRIFRSYSLKTINFLIR